MLANEDYALTKKGKNLSSIEKQSNGKQASLCRSCTKNDNTITNVSPTNLTIGLDFSSQSPPTNPTDVLRLSWLSYSFMSRFHHDIIVVVHYFNMEIPMQNFNLVSVEECLKSISLNLSHLEIAKDDILLCGQAHGDTFKRFFLTVNSLLSLLCK